MTRINIGLLGFGRIAELVHVPVLQGLTNVRIAGVAEADPGRRAQAEKVTGAPGYESFHALLDSRSVEAVVVCLPTPYHADAAVAAFEAGLHVYLEKPIASNAPDAERVVSAWRAAGTVGMAGLNFRHNPHYQQMRQLISDGVLGKIVSMRSVMTSSPRSLPEWKQHRESGGGVLLDLASHHIDLVHFLLGESIDRVQGSVRSVRSEQDTAVLQARSQSGVLYSGTFSMVAPETHQFEVLGDAAIARFDRSLDRRVQVLPLGGASSQSRRIARVLDALNPQVLLRGWQPEPSFTRALDVFARAVRSGEPVSPSLHDAALSLRVVLAAEASARSGALQLIDHESITDVGE